MVYMAPGTGDEFPIIKVYVQLIWTRDETEHFPSIHVNPAAQDPIPMGENSNSFSRNMNMVVCGLSYGLVSF